MEKQTRKPNRLKDYDYSQNGAYFITICTKDRKPILSTIENRTTTVGEGLAPPETKLTDYGKIIETELLKLEQRYIYLKIDKYVIMPNHIHLLLQLDNEAGGASPSPTISDIICAFKSLSIKECKKRSQAGILFQRSFYDHIIRDEYDYQNIWQYIESNPMNWEKDKFYEKE